MFTFQENEVENMLIMLLFLTAWNLYASVKLLTSSNCPTTKSIHFRGGHGTAQKLVQKSKEIELDWQVDQETLGDGNCFYHAVVQQCQRPEIFTALKPECRYLTHLQLRANVCILVHCEYERYITHQPEICEGGNQFMHNYTLTNFHSNITDFQQIGINSMQELIQFQSEGVTKHQYKAWADTLFIQATAVYLGVSIHVMSLTSTKDQPFEKDSSNI
jgi:hypothetical protein